MLAVMIMRHYSYKISLLLVMKAPKIMIAPSSVIAQNQPFASYDSSYNHGSWKLEVPQPP